ncbi:DEAD/DEAH box helicase [Nocardiopsis algeriensis]|uniref:Superfamily II DNA or RNA helicase n=1 Tax=Nocardiopsis algeriensis TaxID=1478215 RepID=A0A841ILA5_9ACTN|nr:DEAD/DEAH box helicase [Nocardiopsis algeriensis]MBB6119443.1 superfamily II DNA or RNA helicase [Nocardiopsis algeriensis]
MNREERRDLDALIVRVNAWIAQAKRIRAQREAASNVVRRAVEHLRRSQVTLHRDGRPTWHSLPVNPKAGALLGDLLAWSRMPAETREDEHTLRVLVEDLPVQVRSARSLLGLRRLFSSDGKKEKAATAASHLADYHARAEKEQLFRRLETLDVPFRRSGVDAAHSLAQELVPLEEHFPELKGRPVLLDLHVVKELDSAISRVRRARKQEASHRDAAMRAGDGVRKAESRKLLAEMPLDRLREATRDRLRTVPLANAGFTTVLDVLDLGDDITALPGIGEKSAAQLLGAARTLWQTTFDEMPARIDIRRRTDEATALLRALHAWDAARNLAGGSALLSRVDELAPLVDHRMPAGTTHVAFYPAVYAPDPDVLRQDIAAVCEGAARLGVFAPGGRGEEDVWDDFTSRPADYFALLSELGINPENEAKATGDLPDEIVQAIRDFSLKTDHLKVAALRGYQSFAARFSLVQRKVVIGDEMGLGKTVEALAALAHLSASGESHFVVICPAAVVTNWTREITAKSTLTAHRVHGPERDRAMRSWIRRGGIAVTTFETLARFQEQMSNVGDLACVVVDEAHYIKNPSAKRSSRTAELIDRSPRAILLTGTPLENRIEEFANLVGYLQPHLLKDVSELNPRRFRKQIAPAYLRRNQEDVLDELPELVEVDEFVPLTTADRIAYRQAVSEGNFAAMRQAAMSEGRDSGKIRRLLEIVEEAEDNGRRVIVFSHFLGVLKQVADVLPGKVIGPLTGSVPAARRQDMVDDFSAAGEGAVLVAQIQAGGVGLNIQAASVIAICEPQLKPTIEWQAIARAHRMGQLESVQVHRLLSEEGVDQRIRQILERKSVLFDDFARRSATAESAPEAFDVSEADLAREIVAEERERLLRDR